MTPMRVESASTTWGIQDTQQIRASYLWHLRLGHIGYDGLSTILRKNIGVGIDIASVSKWELCSCCALGKQTRVSFRSTASDRAKGILDVVHSDVCGPMKTATFSGKCYFVRFIDDKSHYCAAYLIRRKAEVMYKFVQFTNLLRLKQENA